MIVLLIQSLFVFVNTFEQGWIYLFW